MEYFSVTGRWARMSHSLVALSLSLVFACSRGAPPATGATTALAGPERQKEGMEQPPIAKDTLVRVLYQVHWQGLVPIACAQGREFLETSSKLCVDVIPSGTAIKNIDGELIGVAGDVRQREKGNADCEIGPCIVGGERYVSMEKVEFGEGRYFAVWPQETRTMDFRGDNGMSSELNAALLRKAKEIAPSLNTMRVESVAIYELGEGHRYLVVHYDLLSASYFQKDGEKLEAHHIDRDSITSWSPTLLLDLNNDGLSEILECSSDATNDRWATVISVDKGTGKTRGHLQYGCE